MARINIEDSLLKDDKFSELCIKLGSRIMALGTVAEAFIMAQKYYLDESNGRLIPLNEWQRKQTLHVLIDVGLADVEENGIYIKGSNESFKWLLQKSDAGKMSAASKRIKRQKESTAVERTLTDEHGSQPLTPTLPLSLTPTLIQNSNSNNLIITPEPEKKPKLPTQAAKAVDVVEFKISSSKSISIKKDLITAWSDTYPKEYLDFSVKELRNWVLSNEHKAPKSAWAKFMNGWFKRGWERYRTTLKSQPTKLTTDDLNEILGAGL